MLLRIVPALQVLATRRRRHMVLRRPTCRTAGRQATGRRRQQRTATQGCRHTRQPALMSSRATAGMAATDLGGSSAIG